MPQQRSFTSRLPDPQPAPTQYSRAPIAVVLAVATVVGAVASAVPIVSAWHILLGALFAGAVVITDSIQRRRSGKRVAVRVVVGLALTVAGMILLPTLYFLGNPLIAAIAALVIFARRWDSIAVTAAIAVGACGVMIRIVLSAGSVPYLIVLTGITLVALVVLAVTARTSPQAPTPDQTATAGRDHG